MLLTKKKRILICLLLAALLTLSAFGDGGVSTENTLDTQVISGSVNLSSAGVEEISIQIDENNDGSIDSTVNPDSSGNWDAQVSSDKVRIFINDPEIFPREYNYNLNQDKYKLKFNDSESLNVASLRVEADYKVDLAEAGNISGLSGINWVPSVKLGVPDLSSEELVGLMGDPEKAKKEIDVVFEALAFMALNFETESGNTEVMEERIDWEFSKPAELAIEDGSVNCAAAANVIKYLLEDDYEEVGYYWTYTDGRGGHVINYVVDNGSYYFFDPVSITNDNTKFPVENGDLTQRADWADGVIEAEAEDNIKYWLSFSEEMDIAVIYSNVAHALGDGIKDDNYLNMYFPKIQEPANLTVWSTDSDNIYLNESNYNPEPPAEYKNFEPYNQYNDDSGEVDDYQHLKI